MKKLLVANWKMNLSHNQACTWLEIELPSLLKVLQSSEHDLVICPSFTVLPYAIALYPSLSFGAQDCGFEEEGPYTGDVSALSLANLQVSYCIIGHSERRTYYGETDAQIARKAELLLQQGLEPIICIGETADELTSRDTVLSRQLKLMMPFYTVAQPLIAYEPIWSIGTGNIPSRKQLSTIIDTIKKMCAPLEPIILYGGSVEPDVVKEFSPLVSGFLIGSASLDSQLLKKIILSC